MLIHLPVLPLVAAAYQLSEEGDSLCLALTQYGDALGGANFSSDWQFPEFPLLASTISKDSSGEGALSLCPAALETPALRRRGTTQSPP